MTAETGTNDVDVIDLARNFATVHTERARIEKEFKKLKAEVETVFVSRGVPSVTVDGYVVHLAMRERPIAKEGSEEALCDALEADEETSHLVAHRLVGMSEWVGELPVDEKTFKPIFPDHVASLIEIVEKVSACVRKRPKKVKGGA